ncbi:MULTISPECIES: tetratricopeptide repeat protein [Halobacteriovorax]|nr:MULTISPECIES: tetratricopeptide repeat protein [Halobacteriovorax]TGD48635.1 tetratricopeptide repeat protein [Halobacteriovorax sp. Y22]
MKDFRMRLPLVSIFILSLSTTSCSWMGKRKTLFEEEGTADTQQAKSQMVPKAQYDQLLEKYDKLLKETKAPSLAEQYKSSSKPSASQEEVQLEMIDDLEKARRNELAETVDVFANEVAAKKQNQQNDDLQLQKELNLLKQAEGLLAQNRLDQALTILKDLESSKHGQIKVRAKFYLAEMLFSQNEFDLAMQLYEEILRQHAFSGLVIKSLGRLIACTDKLKLKKKNEKYHSILHDFFGEA